MRSKGISTLCGLTLAAGLACAGAALASDAPKMDSDSRFQAMDTNGDGKISADEYAAGAKAMFDKMDANHDGKVTAAEMDAYHSGMGGSGHMSSMTSADRIKAMDADNDGAVSAAEHAADAKAKFASMDTDKDGFLSKAEMAAGHAKMGHKPGA